MAAAAHPAGTSITLTGAQETLLVTLLTKYNDFYRARPLVADRWAVAVLDHLGPAQHAALLARTPRVFSHSVTVPMRTRTMDDWAADFLARHADAPAAVVHLACGLDARALRLRGRCGVDVRWTDLDLPEVIDARRRVAAAMPEPAAAAAGETYEYRMVAADATAREWLEDMPADRPTLVVMEGLSMYLSVEEAEGLIRRLVDHFAPCGGELVLDVMSPQSTALLNWFVRWQRQFDIQFGYAIGSFVDVLKLDERLQLMEGYLFTKNPATRLLSFWPAVLLRLLSWVPYVRGLTRLMRFKM